MKNFKLTQLFGLSAIAVALGACGPQAYVPGTVQSNQDAAGTMNIAPKVDIVLGVSQDGTMNNFFSNVQSDLYNFTQDLQNRGWDYRFVAIPLSEHSPTTSGSFSFDHKVQVSKYDANYSSMGLWISPFPGADPTNPALKVNSLYFTTQFILPGQISQVDGHESGLKNIINFLTRGDVNNVATPNNGFLRPDAMLAMITLTTGEDRSYGQWVPHWNGSTYDYANPDWHADSTGPQQFQGSVSAIKSPLLTKFYTLAALNNNMYNCRGTNNQTATWMGFTYQAATNQVGGKAIDMCNNASSSALGQVSNDLTQQRATFRKRFLSVPSNPSLETVVVTKVSNGSEQVIPQDPTNGWTYYGNVSASSPVYSIDAFLLAGDPTWHAYNAKPISGFIIELHGTAKLVGGDTAKVQYMNSGGQVVAQ
jgi:hypothetical protein